jgi:hypothetical protein
MHIQTQITTKIYHSTKDKKNHALVIDTYRFLKKGMRNQFPYHVPIGREPCITFVIALKNYPSPIFGNDRKHSPTALKLGVISLLMKGKDFVRANWKRC